MTHLTQQQKDLIHKHYATNTLKQLSDIVNRNKETIRGYCNRNGLKYLSGNTKTPLSALEKAYIKQHSSTTNYHIIASHLDRARSTIYHFCIQHRLPIVTKRKLTKKVDGDTPYKRPPNIKPGTHQSRIHQIIKPWKPALFLK